MGIDNIRASLNYYEADELDTKNGKLEIRKKGYKMKSGYFANEWVKVQFYATNKEPDPAKAMCMVFASSLCSSGESNNADEIQKLV